jgi:hypothetical protein
MVQDTVACRPVARQRPRNKQLCNSLCKAIAATDARNNTRTVWIGVFCSIRAEAMSPVVCTLPLLDILLENTLFFILFIYTECSRRSIFWEVIASVILSKKVYTHVYMCCIPYGFRNRAIPSWRNVKMHSDKQQTMSSDELRSALTLTMEFSKMCYYGR